MDQSTRQMLDALRSALRLLGLSNREVEKRLGVSVGYLSRLFSGTIELRFEHLAELARVLEMDPVELLYFAFPRPKDPPTRGARRLREMAGTEPDPGDSGSSPSSPTDEDMERLIAKTLQKLLAPPPPPPRHGGPTEEEVEEMVTKALRRQLGGMIKGVGEK
jgi:transcriptional regulator with XRE-family HTH domain